MPQVVLIKRINYLNANDANQEKKLVFMRHTP